MKKYFKTLLYLVVLVFSAQTVFALNIVELSPGYYPNTSKGRPLSLAYIYVGIPDLDPTVVANQKTLSVQQEDGTIVAVTQPIRTNAGGVPTYLGESVTLLVEGDYSLAVLDNSSVQVYYVPSTAYEQYLIAGNYYYPDYSEADQGVASVGAGSTVTDILGTVGAVTNATLYFSHNSGAATTTYTFTTATTITDNYTVVKERGVLFAGTLVIEDSDAPTPHRSRFRWKDGDEIYIGAAAYNHVGSIRQTVYWNSEITFHLESTGSNSDSENYGADGWHYIYIDDSAVITQGVALLDADCFLNNTTVPTWSITKHGLYNGNDLCIMAVYEGAGAIYEFRHDGGGYAAWPGTTAHQTGAGDIDTAWVEKDLSAHIPGFATLADLAAVCRVKTADGLVSFYIREEGTTNTNIMAQFERIGTDQYITSGAVKVTVSSAQKVDISTSRDNDDTFGLFIKGWYFPRGM